MGYNEITVKGTTTRKGVKKMKEFENDIIALKGCIKLRILTPANFYRLIDMFCEKYGKEKVLAELNNEELW